MDKKNEKTFADLFSSIDTKEDENISNANMIFESLDTELFSNNNDIVDKKVNDSNNNDLKIAENNKEIGITFEKFLSNFDEGKEEYNVASNTDDVNDKVNENVIKDINVFSNDTENEQVNNLFFGDTSSLDNNDMFLNKEKEENGENSLKTENLAVNNETSIQFNDIKSEVNPFLQENEVDNSSNFSLVEEVDKIEEENGEIPLETENLAINNETSTQFNDIKSEVNTFWEENKADNSSGVSLMEENIEQEEEKITKEEKENVIKESDNSIISESVIEVTNPFFGEDDKIDISTDNNPFLNNDNIQVDDMGPINQSLLEKKAEIKKEEKVVSESVSPFFENVDNSLEKIEENILGSKISIDQTMNVNSKLDKIDLTGTKNFNVRLEKKQVPLMKFLIGVMSYAFFIFLVLLLVTLLAYVLDIKIRAAKGDYSAPTFNAYVVLTGSMLPEIQVKDVVVTKKVEVNTLKVGDIITFASSDSRFAGTIITHRILKKNQDVNGNITFQTKGDNNNVADSALVQPNNIYGKVILKIPKLGYLQDFLATQGGWIIVILLPCVTVISYDVVKLAKGLKRRANKIKVIK